MPLGDRGQAAAVSARYRPAPGQPPECGAGLPDAVTDCDAARGVRVPSPAPRRRDARPVQAGRIQEDAGPRAGGCRRALATTPASRRQGFGRP